MALNILFGAKLKDIDELQNQCQKDLNRISKQLNLNLNKIQIKDIDKSINEIQKQLDIVSKQVTLNLSKINFDNNTELKELQNQLNNTLKDKDVKLNISSNIKTIEGDFEGILNKSRKLQSEIKMANNQLARMDSVLDKRGDVKATTLSYQYDKDRQAIEKYGWVAKQQGNEVVQVYDLISKKLVDNKQKAELAQVSQDNYLKDLEFRLNKLKDLSTTQNRKNENYDNTSNLRDIANLENKVRSIRQENISLSQKEKNELSQITRVIENNIKKESGYAQEISKTSRFLQSQLRTLEHLRIRIENRGGGNKSEQARIANELNKQVALYNELIQKNEVLGTVERNRIQRSTNDMRVQTNALTRYESSFSNIFNRMKDYAIGGSIIYSAIAQAKQGFNDIISVDNQMRDLKKVTNETSEEYENFKNKANEISMSLGNQTENVIAATTAFAQMGFSYKEAQTLAQNSIIYQNVGDMNQKEATKGLISTMKAFNIEAKDSTQIMDKANEVSNHYAISVEGINKALTRGGSALHVKGVSLNESISLITAANSAIQDPARVGNGLKTISMNLTAVKKGANGIKPKLEGIISSVTKGEVQVRKSNGEFKNTYEIIQDLSSQWCKLNSVQKAMLGEQIAGKHQVMMPRM